MRHDPKTGHGAWLIAFAVIGATATGNARAGEGDVATDTPTEVSREAWEETAGEGAAKAAPAQNAGRETESEPPPAGGQPPSLPPPRTATSPEPSAPAEEIEAAPAPMPAKRSYKAVLYDLNATEIQAEHLDMVEASLLAELRKLKGVAAMGMVDVRAMLSAEEARQIAGCEADEKCVSAIAGALGADFLILGNVGKVGTSTVITLKRLDMMLAEVTHTTTKRMRGGGGEELLEAIGPAIEELFPDFEIRPGLSRGVAAEVVERWDPPPIPPWVTYGAGGVAAALTVVALVALVQQKVAESEYGGLVAASTEKAISGRNLVAAERTARSSYDVFTVFAPTAAAIWVAAGVLFLFTDWQGASAVAPQVGVSPGAAWSLGVTVRL